MFGAGIGVLYLAAKEVQNRLVCGFGKKCHLFTDRGIFPSHFLVENYLFCLIVITGTPKRKFSVQPVFREVIRLDSESAPTLITVAQSTPFKNTLTENYIMEKQDRDIEKLAFSIAETARTLGVSSRTIHDYVKNGSIPHFRMGARLLIPADELKAFIERRTRTGKS